MRDNVKYIGTAVLAGAIGFGFSTAYYTLKSSRTRLDPLENVVKEEAGTLEGTVEGEPFGPLQAVMNQKIIGLYDLTLKTQQGVNWGVTVFRRPSDKFPDIKHGDRIKISDPICVPDCKYNSMMAYASDVEPICGDARVK